MIARYGGYSHEADSVSVAGTGRRVFDQYGRERLFKVRYVLTGTVTGTSQSEITTKCTALENAYAQQGGDFVFLDNSSNETVHVLRSSECLGGTRTHGVDYLDGMPGIWGAGTEYVKLRSYRVVIEGDIRNSGGLKSWEETWTYVGTAGPEHKWVESLLGDPERQTLKQRTTTIAVQRGSAVGDDTYPAFPASLAPEWLMNIKGRSPQFSLSTPRYYKDGQATDYGIRWTYIHEAPIVLAGTPTPSPE